MAIEIATHQPLSTLQGSTKTISETLDLLSDAPDTKDSPLTMDICDSYLFKDSKATNMERGRRNTTGGGLSTNPSWRAPDNNGTVSMRAPENNGTLSISRVIPGPVFPSEAQLNVAFTYGIRREDGTFTRLLRADEFNAYDGVPPPAGPHGMIVLPAIRNVPPPVGHQSTTMVDRSVVTALPSLPSYGAQGSADPTQRTIDSIIERNAAMPSRAMVGPNVTSPNGRRAKVYCDKWIHTGDCAFAQVGCRYKHEMPMDTETQMLVGLNNGVPQWYRRMMQSGGSNLGIGYGRGSSNLGGMGSGGYIGSGGGMSTGGFGGGHYHPNPTWRAMEGGGVSTYPVEPRRYTSRPLFPPAGPNAFSALSSLEENDDTDESEVMTSFRGRNSGNGRA